MSGKLEEISEDKSEVEPKDQPFDRYGNYQATVYSKNFTNLFNHLTGKVLTIIDASVVDPVQRDAMKQLIKTAIWENNDVLQEWMWGQLNDEGSTFPF